MFLRFNGLSVTESVRMLLGQANFRQILIFFVIPTFLLAWAFDEVPDYDQIFFKAVYLNANQSRFKASDKAKFKYLKLKSDLRDNIRQEKRQWEEKHHLSPKHAPMKMATATPAATPSTKELIKKIEEKSASGYLEAGVRIMQIFLTVVSSEMKDNLLSVTSLRNVGISIFIKLAIGLISLGMLALGFRLGAENMSQLPPVTIREMLRLILGSWYSLCLWPILFLLLILVICFYSMMLGFMILVVLVGLWYAYREIQGSHRRFLSFCLTEDWRVLFNKSLRERVLNYISTGKLYAVLLIYTVLTILYGTFMAGFEVIMLGTVSILSKTIWPKLLLALGETLKATLAFAFMAGIGHVWGKLFFQMQPGWPFRKASEIPPALLPHWGRGGARVINTPPTRSAKRLPGRKYSLR